MRRTAFALATALALVACGRSAPPAEFGYPPSPALFEIAEPDGEIEGWLFGTIHALPDGVEWTSPPLQSALGAADTLVVETRDLDSASLREAFEARAHTAGQPPLPSKVPASLRPTLDEIIGGGRVPGKFFGDLETWAAALVVAQLAEEGDAANGVDRALLGRFPAARTVELEGTAHQLDLFDRLPEREQRDLLAAVLADFKRYRDDPHHGAEQWYRGEIDRFADPLESALMADPELRQVFYSTRNRAFAARIDALLKKRPRPLVAVGAAHLSGDESLPALLAARGYRVRRLQ